MAKGKHSTPEELDDYFSRGTIDEDLYQDFWAEWWSATSRAEKEDIIERYAEESIEERIAEAFEEGEGVEELPLRGSVTKTRRYAEQQAKIIGGYVARRNASGRFDKNGRFYQAIRKRRKIK